jgi:WXXGXW repeat (2 copies)
MKITQITLLALVCGSAPLAVGAGLDIGINIGGPEVVVRSQPPPERIETVPMSPGPGYAWIRGHWVWHREHWEWKAGYFERASQPGSVWVSGQWVARGNGWVWMEGHYTVSAPAPVYYNTGPSAEVVANEAPPAEIVETIPVAPGPDSFWIGGHWSWNGRWVWVHGRYDRHPHFHPGAGWEAGRWDRRGGGWVWHEGHWR